MKQELLLILRTDAAGSTELLLAGIKLMLGLQFLWAATIPTSGLVRLFGPLMAAALGVAWLVIASVQVMGVGKNWARWRQIAALGATFMWLFFLGTAWNVNGSPMGTLVYIPLLVFNISIFWRVAQMPIKPARGEE